MECYSSYDCRDYRSYRRIVGKCWTIPLKYGGSCAFWCCLLIHGAKNVTDVMSVFTLHSAPKCLDLTGIIRLVFIRELVWWRKQIECVLSVAMQKWRTSLCLVAVSDSEIQNKVPMNLGGIHSEIKTHTILTIDSAFISSCDKRVMKRCVYTACGAIEMFAWKCGGLFGTGSGHCS